MRKEGVLDEFLHLRSAPAAPELVRPADSGRLECLACAHRCRLAEGHPGVCRVRFVEGGILRRPRGYVAGLAVDPIEKKPFFHVRPGARALTFGMLGCDLHCAYCQNWTTSQALRDGIPAGVREISSADVSDAALRMGARVVVSSYNEPLITADWAAEVFRRAKARGLECGFVSNGNATPEVLEYLRPLVRFFKVDLKGFRESSYRDFGGRLKSVLDTIERLVALGFWVEVVTLLVPGLNDDPGEIRALTAWLAGVSRDVPWHVTAFHPDYRLTDRERTPVRSLLEAYDRGREAGLRFVYAGNLPGEVGGREDTVCPGCGERLVERRGFQVLGVRLRGGACARCGLAIPGVWDEADRLPSAPSG